MRGTLEERLLAGFHLDEAGCWIWTKVRVRGGYGQISFERRGLMAHRVAYELFVGPIPDGLQLDHLCRVTSCINPDHLEAVTAKENLRRKEEALGIGQYLEHCRHGHPFTEANTRVTEKPGYPGSRIRLCRTCSVRWTSEWKARQRQKQAAS